ncbi:hypothetical protein BASA81_005848 [Batrachochytrium salamandrivorans]|nr:hypothetical protein BASA81_005848 [Batrachochytrium salamandrivorans]
MVLLGVLMVLVFMLVPRCLLSTCGSKPCTLQQPLPKPCPKCISQTFKLTTVTNAVVNSHRTSSEWEAELLRLMEMNLENGFTIVATANFGHKEFTLNWITSLKRNGFHKFLVICFDLNLYTLLVEYGLHEQAVLAPSGWFRAEGIASAEVLWMSKEYNALTLAKLQIQRQLLEHNFPFVFSDVDLVFASPHTVSNIRQQFGSECTGKNTSSCLTDFAYMVDQDTDINTGFFAVMPTPQIKLAFDNTIKDIRRWGVDQIAFNYQVRTVMKIKYSRHFKPLDKVLFVNGWGLTQDQINAKLAITPLVVHANYVEGKEAKIRMLTSHGYWYL